MENLDLSICMIVKNEVYNLERHLLTYPKGAELIVVDSGSTDRTPEVLHSFGARVVQHEFQDYSSQKNFALSQATRRWILVMDADESMEPATSELIKQVVLNNDLSKAYFFNRSLIFMGQPLRYGKSQDRVLRLFPRGKGRYEGSVHEKLITQDLQHLLIGSSKDIRLLHHSYRNLDDYTSKLHLYTSLIAKKNESSGRKRVPSRIEIFLRPWFVFFDCYILRGGFIDGYRGFLFAYLSSTYSLLKAAKTRERQLLVKD